MDNKEESSTKIDINNPTDGTSRSQTNILPEGPIVAAGRLVSSSTKQPRNLKSTRNYTIAVGSRERNSFLKPLSKRFTSTRDHSSSDLNSFNPTSSSNTMHNSKTIPSDLNQISKTIDTPTPDTVGLDFNFDSTYTQLRELADSNCNYFAQQKTDVFRRFEHLLIQLLNSIDSSIPYARYLTDNFHHFDYSPEV